MQDTQSKIHWPSALLVAFNGLSILSLLTSTVVFAGLALVDWWQKQGDFVGLAMLAGGAFTGSLLLIPGAFYGFRRLIGRLDETPITVHMSPAMAVAGVAVWAAAVATGYWVLPTPFAGIVMPLIGVLGTALPIWFIAHVALEGMELGPPLRTWATFSLGLALGPLVILVVETFALIAFVLLIAIFIAANPPLAREMQSLMQRFSLIDSQEHALQLLQPYLFRPITLFLTLVAVSIVIPLTEESLKTLGVWVMGSRIRRPLDGYIAGILCGAGYALFESISIGSSGAQDWTLVALARSGTDVVHILNGGLLGWALACAWREGRYGRLAVTFGLVIFIHGLWNALSILMGFGGAVQAGANPPAWLLNLLPISGLSLGVLTAALAAILIVSNRHLRRTAQEKQV